MFLGNTAAALQVLPACSPGWTVLGGTVTPNPVNFPINYRLEASYERQACCMDRPLNPTLLRIVIKCGGTT
jgi:hypothetical protein